jgi:hypothetical protein
MKRAQPQNLQTATSPTTCKVEEQQTSEQANATARPQLCKVESNKNKKHGMNQRTSINHQTSDVGGEQFFTISLQTTPSKNMERNCTINI